MCDRDFFLCDKDTKLCDTAFYSYFSRELFNEKRFKNGSI